jgi:amino acid transporter
VAWQLSWLAFAIAVAITSLTALSYAELSARSPRSGGEADFAKESFRSKSLSLFFGRLVLCSVVLSMATVSHAFAFYVLDATETAFPLGKHRLAACFL